MAGVLVQTFKLTGRRMELWEIVAWVTGNASGRSHVVHACHVRKI